MFDETQLQYEIVRVYMDREIDNAIAMCRNYINSKHGQVDDTPYGGGAGMLMMAPPIFEAVESVIAQYDSDINSAYSID